MLELLSLMRQSNYSSRLSSKDVIRSLQSSWNRKTRIINPMDQSIMCSLCGKSKWEFIPLLCSHTLCVDCSTRQVIIESSLPCPLCD